MRRPRPDRHHDRRHAQKTKDVHRRDRREVHGSSKDGGAHGDRNGLSLRITPANSAF